MQKKFWHPSFDPVKKTSTCAHLNTVWQLLTITFQFKDKLQTFRSYKFLSAHFSSFTNYLFIHHLPRLIREKCFRGTLLKDALKAYVKEGKHQLNRRGQHHSYCSNIGEGQRECRVCSEHCQLYRLIKLHPRLINVNQSCSLMFIWQWSKNLNVDQCYHKGCSMLIRVIHYWSYDKHRSGSLLEILIYVPHGGHFLRVQCSM